jgi:hypothetical protein
MLLARRHFLAQAPPKEPPTKRGKNVSVSKLSGNATTGVDLSTIGAKNCRASILVVTSCFIIVEKIADPLIR